MRRHAAHPRRRAVVALLAALAPVLFVATIAGVRVGPDLTRRHEQTVVAGALGVLIGGCLTAATAAGLGVHRRASRPAAPGAPRRSRPADRRLRDGRSLRHASDWVALVRSGEAITVIPLHGVHRSRLGHALHAELVRRGFAPRGATVLRVARAASAHLLPTFRTPEHEPPPVADAAEVGMTPHALERALLTAWQAAHARCAAGSGVTPVRVGFAATDARIGDLLIHVRCLHPAVQPELPGDFRAWGEAVVTIRGRAFLVVYGTDLADGRRRLRAGWLACVLLPDDSLIPDAVDVVARRAALT